MCSDSKRTTDHQINRHPWFNRPNSGEVHTREVRQMQRPWGSRLNLYHIFCCITWNTKKSRVLSRRKFKMGNNCRIVKLSWIVRNSNRKIYFKLHASAFPGFKFGHFALFGSLINHEEYRDRNFTNLHINHEKSYFCTLCTCIFNCCLLSCIVVYFHVLASHRLRS